MTAAAWSVIVNSCFFCIDVLSCYRAYESGLEIADRVRNEGLDGWLSSSLVLKDSSLDSRWRGVFAHHQASAVGKARRPFIRLSEK